MKKISYSAWKRYLTCPKMYDFHYNQRLRPKATSSALLFGSAMDAALNTLLLDQGDALQVFRDAFKFEDVKDCEWIDKDWDPELLRPDQFDALKDESDARKKWACLRIKGRLMLEEYIDTIYPLIEEVHDVQLALTGRPGFIDTIVTLRGFGKVLIDHKTASRPYPNDSVAKDTQLALYASSIGLQRVGFVVLNKNINKNKVKICKACGFNGSFTRYKTCPQDDLEGNRCNGAWKESVQPKAKIQLLVTDVSSSLKKLMQESITDVEDAIKKQAFPRNLGACDKMYGKPCPYYKKCWGNNEEDLEYAEPNDL